MPTIFLVSHMRMHCEKKRVIEHYYWSNEKAPTTNTMESPFR